MRSCDIGWEGEAREARRDEPTSASGRATRPLARAPVAMDTADQRDRSRCLVSVETAPCYGTSDEAPGAGGAGGAGGGGGGGPPGKKKAAALNWLWVRPPPLASRAERAGE